MDKDLIENIIAEAPSEEPDRQAFFKEECAKILSCMAKERNRELTFHVNTFGCQMNAKDSEKLARISRISDTGRLILKMPILYCSIPVPSVKMPTSGFMDV